MQQKKAHVLDLAVELATVGAVADVLTLAQQPLEERLTPQALVRPTVHEQHERQCSLDASEQCKCELGRAHACSQKNERVP